MQKYLIVILSAGLLLASQICPAVEMIPLGPPYTVNIKDRSFYMGFTPAPSDFTPESILINYEFIANHGDLIAHHFDEGIPWPEARGRKAFDPKIDENINFRLSQKKTGRKVFLAVTPLSSYRDGVAEYWTSESDQPLPDGWKDKGLDDGDVIVAYTNFCRYMIYKFQPDYMAYGIEVNMLAEKNPAQFEKYMKLLDFVYKTLKQENPNLPLFLTIQAESFHKDKVKQAEAIKKLLPFTDYIAVSSYPYIQYPDPKDIPSNWLSQIHDLAPDKPFAISETGFMAEDLYSEEFKTTIPGNEDWQLHYVHFLLNEVNRLKGKFVVWYVPKDYDVLWESLKQAGMPEIFKLWKDTGFLNEKDVRRKALKLWDHWLDLPVQ